MRTSVQGRSVLVRRSPSLRSLCRRLFFRPFLACQFPTYHPRHLRGLLFRRFGAGFWWISFRRFPVKIELSLPLSQKFTRHNQSRPSSAPQGCAAAVAVGGFLTSGD